MTAHLMGSPAGVTDGSRILLASFVKTLIYLAVTAAIIALAAFAVVSRSAIQYRAETTIVINAADSLPLDAVAVAPDLVAAQVHLINSPDMARTVVQSLDLEGRPAFVAAIDNGSAVAGFLSRIGLERHPTRVAREEQVLEAFAANLSVAADRGGRAITVGFTSSDPELAADVANAVAGEYVALQRTAAQDLAEGAASTLQAEIGALERKIGGLEVKAEAYRNGIGRLLAAPVAVDPARQERAAAQLRGRLIEIEEEAARQRERLDATARRYRAALDRRQSGFLPVEAHIVSAASPPSEPSFPQKWLITAVLAALALAIMGTLVAVWNLARGRQPRDVGDVPLPEVADGGLSEGKALWLDDRGVRRIMPAVPTIADNDEGNCCRESTNLVADRLIGDRARRIMVVTAGGEVGKRRPLAAVALARALARADRRPVLIDLRDDGADSRSMGEGADLPGFSDLLAGTASFGQVIFRDRKSRVHFIPSGQPTLPEEDLADGRVGMLVSALDHTYDHVVLDVGGDIEEAIGPGCDVAVIATEFDDGDPRLDLAVKRVRAHSNVPVIVLKARPVVASPRITATADGKAA